MVQGTGFPDGRLQGFSLGPGHRLQIPASNDRQCSHRRYFDGVLVPNDSASFQTRVSHSIRGH
eukprot:2295483-Rhodomonas_salina.1